MNDTDFGLWPLACASALFFTVFAGCFFKAVTRGDGHLLGAFGVFVFAHFAERYGFPLTLHMVSAWLPVFADGIDPASHASGHLWSLWGGEQANPHASLAYVASYAFIGGGFWLLAYAGHVLEHAQRVGRLAVSGPYARVRHPQKLAFALVVTGLLLQWPTVATLAMLPLFLVMGLRVAQTDEDTLQLQFGLAYAEYASGTPAFVPGVSLADMRRRRGALCAESGPRNDGLP